MTTNTDIKTSNLRFNVSRWYAPDSTAKSVVRSRNPVNRKAYSRYTENVTFFVPEIQHNISPLFWALYGAEAAQAVEGRHLYGTGQPVDGIANSVQRPPYSIRNDVLGCQKLNVKVRIMKNDKLVAANTPEGCYAGIKTSIDAKTLIDPIYMLLHRSEATLCLLQDNGKDVNTGFTMNHKLVTAAIDGVQGDLAQIRMLLDGMSGGDHD